MTSGQTWTSLHHVKNVLLRVYRSYNLSFRMQSKARKTIVTQWLLNTRKYAFRRNSPFGVTASVFVHGSTCITIAISVNIMHIAIFNVGKEKRHFSTSKFSKSLSCNHKHKTCISTLNAINWLSLTSHFYCRFSALNVKCIWLLWRHGQTTVRRHKNVHTFL